MSLYITLWGVGFVRELLTAPSVPDTLQCPQYQQLTTASVPIRSRVRSISTSPAPPHPRDRYESGRASPNKTRPVRRIHSCDQKIFRAPNGNRTGIFPVEADEPYNFVRSKSHRQKISRAAELRSRRIFFRQDRMRAKKYFPD